MTREELEEAVNSAVLSASESGRLLEDENVGSLLLSVVETVAQERRFRPWSPQLRDDMKEEAVLKLYRTALPAWCLERGWPWVFLTIAVRKSFLTTAKRYCIQKARYDYYMALQMEEHPELLNDVDARKFIESLLKPPLYDEWET